MDVSSYVISVASAISAAQAQQSVGIAVAKNVMDVQETQANALLQMMGQNNAMFGQRLDVRI